MSGVQFSLDVGTAPVVVGEENTFKLEAVLLRGLVTV